MPPAGQVRPHRRQKGAFLLSISHSAFAPHPCRSGGTSRLRAQPFRATINRLEGPYLGNPGLERPVQAGSANSRPKRTVCEPRTSRTGGFAVAFLSVPKWTLFRLRPQGDLTCHYRNILILRIFAAKGELASQAFPSERPGMAVAIGMLR